MATAVEHRASAVASPGVSLRRDVGVLGLTFTSLGCVIGSGWLLGALEASEHAGPAAIVSYVLAGAIMLVLALVYAELGAAYHVTGGISRMPHVAFGPLAGFASGWVAWLGSVTLAPIEVEAALQYLTPKISSTVTLTRQSGGGVVLTAAGYATAAVLMLLFTLVNARGIGALARSNNVAVVWKIAVPVIAAMALISVSFHTGNFSSSAAGGFAPFGIKGILQAMPFGVVFSLTGFEQAVQLGGEARNPGRDMPRAVVGSLLLGILLYGLLEVAFVGSLSPSAIAHGWSDPLPKGDYGPFATIATGLGLGWLAVLLYTDAVVSPGGTGLVYVGTSSRAAYTLSRSGYLPPALGKVDKRAVPRTAILLSFAVGMIMFLPFPGWQSLVQFISSASALMFSFAPLALAALRRGDPHRERPYRLPAAHLLAPASFAAAALLIYWSGWQTVWKLLAALAIGFVVFALSQSIFRGIRISRADLDLRTLAWLVPYLSAVGLISYFGQFGGGTGDIPLGLDIVLVVAAALATYAVAVRRIATAEWIQGQLAQEENAEPA